MLVHLRVNAIKLTTYSFQLLSNHNHIVHCVNELAARDFPHKFHQKILISIIFIAN